MMERTDNQTTMATQDEDVDILLARCFDAVAERDDYRRLEALLNSDPAVRERYVRMCQLRQSLSNEVKHADAWSTCAPIEKPQRDRRYFVRELAAIAAAVTLVTALWPRGEDGTNAPDQQPPAPILAAGDDSQRESGVATIIRKINCVWSDDAWALSSSSEITAGQTISLERGFMSLALHNGVTIALEGPVKFTVINDVRGALEFGGLGVRVPEGFSGYVVDTPTAKVTDLGTEFSVRVSDDGATDLSVIEGEVEVSLLSDGDTTEPLVLEKDDEWSSVLGIKKPEGSPSSTDFPTSTLLEDPAFFDTPELPQQDGLLLWLSADSAVKTDGHGGVLAWGDISSRASIERHSAWQVERRRRPRLLDDRIGEMPAIRFDGVDDCLITEPFVTGDAQTIAIVGRLDTLEPKPDAIRGPQFINYNGPPNVVVEYDHTTRSIRGRVFAGFGNEPRVSGQSRVEPASSEETLAIIYTYDHAANEAVLYLNGQRGEVSEARVASSSSRPKVIGIHSRLKDSGLAGDIAEVLIFDRALGEVEAATLFDYFNQRYGAPVVQRQTP